MSVRLDVLARRPWLFPLVAIAWIALVVAFVMRVPSTMAVPALGLYLLPIVGAGVLGVLAALRWPRAPLDPPIPERPRLHLAAIVGTLVLLVGAVLSLSDAHVWKPLEFYLLYSAAVLLLFLQALFAPPRAWAAGLSTMQCILLMGVFGAATHLMTPMGAGADAVFHREAATALAETGSHHALTQPYHLFAGYHDSLAFAIQLGMAPRDALSVQAFLFAAAIAGSVALFVGRALGSRPAMASLALLAGTPGALTALAGASPSKAGIWVILASGFVFLAASTRTRIALLAFAVPLTAAYHPTLALALLLAAGGYILYVLLLGAGDWAPAVGSAFGFDRSAAFGAPWRHRLVLLLGLVAAGIGGLVLMSIAMPQLYALFMRPFTFQGAQEAAIGAVRTEFVGPLLTETLLLNVATSLFIAPAIYMTTRGLLAPTTRGTLLLATTVATIVATIGIVIVARIFLLGPERFLALLDVLVMCLAGAAVVAVMGARRRGIGKTVPVVTVFAIAGVLLIGVSSYRVDGSDIFSPHVPKQTDYVTREIDAAVVTLKPHLRDTDRVNADLYSVFYAANFPAHTDETLWYDPVARDNITQIPPTQRPAAGAWVMYNEEAAERSNEIEAWRSMMSAVSRAYDNGLIVGGVA